MEGQGGGGGCKDSKITDGRHWTLDANKMGRKEGGCTKRRGRTKGQHKKEEERGKRKRRRKRNSKRPLRMRPKNTLITLKIALVHPKNMLKKNNLRINFQYPSNYKKITHFLSFPASTPFPGVNPSHFHTHTCEPYPHLQPSAPSVQGAETSTQH